MQRLWDQPLSWTNAAWFTLGALCVLAVVIVFVTYAIYFERKIIGWMQFRKGPNRVGPFGLLQTVADVAKLLLKEDTIPAKADRVLFIMAPALAFIPSFAALSIIPYGMNLQFADVNVGFLYYVALLGGMRSAAQMISYEVPLVISVVGVAMMTGSLNLREIVLAQEGYFWNWNFLPQIIGFGVFLVSALAELNRTPFDLPEAESELVAGYHTEYSGFRFAFFMLAEYVYLYAIACLTTILFLGGWHPPLPQLDFIPGIVWFILKFLLVVFFVFWVRATFPRLRVDQLMGLAWKVLLPLAMLNIFITAAGIHWFGWGD